MFVLQFVSAAILTFFASTVWAASVALYAGTFDPPSRFEERIIRCALGDRSLSTACQKMGQEISHVLVLVNEDGGPDTLASTRERVLMVKKALEDYRGQVEIRGSTPAQTAERIGALLADQNIDRLFHLIGPEPVEVLQSIPAHHESKVVRVLFPLELQENVFKESRLINHQLPSGAKEVIAKLGLYHPVSEDLAPLQESLFDEGWRDFLSDLISACPETISEKICSEVAPKWRAISVVAENQAKKMDPSELSSQNLLVYKRSQSEDRWAEKFSKTATKFLAGSDGYDKLRAVADDIAAKTFQGYPYGKVPHLRAAFIQGPLSSVEPLTVRQQPVTCSASQGPYHMDMDRYLADRFPRAFARFLTEEFGRSSSTPIDLYVHNHSIEQAYEFHRRDGFDSFYFLQTRRGQHHRQIYLAIKSQPRAYRVVFASVRGNDRQANVLCQIHRSGIFANYHYVESKEGQPLFVLNSQGLSLTLNPNDLLMFGFKGNLSRMLVALDWKRTPLVKEGLDIDVFTHPLDERKLVIARNVYGDDTEIVLDTFYKKGLRRAIYLGSAGAIADHAIGHVVIPNEFIAGNSDFVPFQNNLAHEFQPELSRLLTVHGQQRHGWVPTLFHENKDLLLEWRAKSIGAVDIEGLHLARFARRHDDLKIGIFFVVSDQALGDRTLNESNAHRGIIDRSVDKLLSFLVGKLLRPSTLMPKNGHLG
jgi:uridine phosphorylase